MTSVKLKLKEDGVYVDNPSSEKEFIENLKQSLNELGLSDLDENSFLKTLGNNPPDTIRLSEELPAEHDAIVEFSWIDEDQITLQATVLPATNGTQLFQNDIQRKLIEDGYSDVLIDNTSVLEALGNLIENPVKISFLVGKRIIPKIEISISDDTREAYMTILRDDPDLKIQFDDMMRAIKKAGVIKGILIPRLREIENQNGVAPQTVIAKAIEPIKGKDGTVIYNFDALGRNKKPKLDEFGNADFRMLDLFESVQVGAPLCEVTPGKEGISGYNVKGELIPAEHGDTPPLPEGKNTEVNPENPNELLASIDGTPKLVMKKVNIDPILNIKGDVGMATGNVDFVGSIKIYGKIVDGFSVKAQGDVFVNETCESVTIESEKDIILQHGIRSDEGATLIAKGDVHAKFLEGTTVIAGGEVVVQEYCYHCDIKAGPSVKVIGKKGYIAGGKISAKNNVYVKKLGSQAAPKTEIFINHSTDFDDVTLSPPQKQKLNSLMEKYEKLRNELASMKPSGQQQPKDPFDETADEAPEMSQMTNAQTQLALNKKKIIEQLEMQKAQIVKRIKMLSPQFIEAEEDTGHFVAVLDTVHPNVTISIDNSQITTKNEFCRLRFVNRKGKIVMEKYEPGDAHADLQNEY